ncbi:hypothetical protein [Salinisphaera sp. G21_0]|uniref:hypothetical protein n=1 Tax=Salinisphaera sp. G21_0 TaxID=2821094 RepID=UPI001ADAF4CE|nr:hypothetical protein [Salinisphaera sp. G21_0]MBO9484626.1 hypothetical protein [Salinisphaera sp. G21_0]
MQKLQIFEREKFTVQGGQIRGHCLLQAEGGVCSYSDKEGRPTVFDKLPKLKGEHWIPIGCLDLKVSRLKRVRFGSMIIPDQLRQGQFQELEKPDIDVLAALPELNRLK